MSDCIRLIVAAAVALTALRFVYAVGRAFDSLDRDYETPRWKSLACGVYAAFLLFIFVMASTAAPAPVYREPPPLHKRIEGSWDMNWSGSRWECTVCPDGVWGCSRCEELWYGTWKLSGNDLILRGRRLDTFEEQQYEWTVTIETIRSKHVVGTLPSGQSIILRSR